MIAVKTKPHFRSDPFHAKGLYFFYTRIIYCTCVINTRCTNENALIFRIVLFVINSIFFKNRVTWKRALCLHMQNILYYCYCSCILPRTEICRVNEFHDSVCYSHCLPAQSPLLWSTRDVDVRVLIDSIGGGEGEGSFRFYISPVVCHRRDIVFFFRSRCVI